MKQEIADRLSALNLAFYERFAGDFSASRAEPQPGFERLLAALPPGDLSVLDVGCGDGRFGRFLAARLPLTEYVGVDFSESLLSRAAAATMGNFYARDLSREGALSGLDRYSVVACLAALQHIPGYENRRRLLAEMSEHLLPGGRIALANWQFLDSARQRRKVRPWSEIGLEADDVEEGDYLLSWRRGGYGLRYVCYIDAGMTERMAAETGLRIIEQYRSDGREGDLSLYTILAV